MLSQIQTPTDAQSPAAKGLSTSRSLTASLLGFLCIGVSFFLIAVIVVLGLIPLYVSNNPAPLTTTTTNSQLITLINEIQASTSGRKRAAGDLTSYVGYEFDTPGLAVVEDRLKDLFPKAYVDGVKVNRTYIGTGDTSAKSLRLVKRQNFNSVYLIIVFYVKYAKTCSTSCRENNAPTFKSALENADTSKFNFENIALKTSDGRTATLPRAQSVRKVYVSDVLPQGSGKTTGTTPFVASSRSTSTVAIAPFAALTTPNVG